MTTQTQEDKIGWQGDRSTKLLKCSSETTAIMKQYYKEMHEAKARGEPIVYISSWEPQEIFRAMGIDLFFPLHYSSLCAATQMSRRYLDNLQEAGWSKDVCRFCGQRLGYIIDNNKEDAPWGGMPKPDLFVQGSIDDLQGKIIEYEAEALDTPFYLYDRTWPIRVSSGVYHDFDTADYRVEYVIKQYRELIGFLENFFHRELEMGKLKEAVRNSVEMYRLWWEVDELRRTVPAPITSTDFLPNMPPMWYFRGLEKGVETVRQSRDEVKERVDNGLAAVPNERIRLLWPEVPPWFTTGFFNAFEEEYGAVFAFETYHFPEWFHKVDPEKPIEALAKLYGTYVEETANAPGKIEEQLEVVRTHSIDGVIFMLIESCKALSNAVLLSHRGLAKAGIPSLIIKQDMVDIRDWDDKKIKSEVAAFIETLNPTRRQNRS